MIKLDIPIFVIHYTKLIERKQYLEPILEKKYSRFKFINEYDKETLEKDVVNKSYIKDKNEFERKIIELWKIRNEQYRELSSGELSCFFKHLEALKLISDSNFEYSLIIEDDVIPVNDFDVKINKTMKIMKNKKWDVIFLGQGIGKNFLNQKLGFKRVFPNPQIVNHPASNCADSYIVKKDVAQKLLTNFRNFHLSYDWELAYQMYKLNLDVYWCTRPMFTQGSKTGSYDSALR